MTSALLLPSAFAALDIIDVRSKLDVQPSDPPGCRRARKGLITGATLHYNGPAVKGFGNPALEERQVIQIDVPNHQQRIGADSLQYHFVVLSDGAILLTRDLSYQAWHCGVEEGNEHSLAVHLPLGGTQDATAVQWQSTLDLFNAIIVAYGLKGRTCIKGHQEWKPTLCPGVPLMARLNAWRSGLARQGGMFHIRDDVAAANVREGPARSFPVALQGKAIMYPGDTVDADGILVGEAIGSDNRWLHRRDGVGFLHMSLMKERGAADPAPPPDDLPFASSPRMSRDRFANVLTTAKSPAAPEASSLYDIPIRYGLDPAVALAIFGHESSYGKAGRAVSTKNWGNIRRSQGLAAKVEEGFGWYDTWAASLEDWCRLITRDYINPAKHNAPTVRTALRIYAPSSDGNNPDAYANAVIKLVRQWEQGA